MRKWLMIALMSLASILSPALLIASGVAEMPEEQTQIREEIIHKTDEIRSLTRLKNYYMAKATRYRNRATRMRYHGDEESYNESQILVQQAADYEKIVKKLNADISKLEREKRSLEKKLGE